jgi:antitoxin (DNA-binding transcriptional repressor) of toxin-antitoxin stability system
MQFDMAQVMARLSELASLVDAGEEVVIVKHGRPSYKLVAATSVRAEASPTALASHTPTDLGEMNTFVEQIRSKSTLLESTVGFVAEWRQGARY